MNCQNCGPLKQICVRCGAITDKGIIFQGVPLCEECIIKLENEEGEKTK